MEFQPDNTRLASAKLSPQELHAAFSTMLMNAAAIDCGSVIDPDVRRAEFGESLAVNLAMVKRFSPDDEPLYRVLLAEYLRFCRMYTAHSYVSPDDFDRLIRKFRRLFPNRVSGFINKEMENMADRDGKYFNCSEEHELNQVSGKYRDREKVKAFIREKCKDKTIHYWTHEKLAAYLAENGFQPVKAISQTEFIEGISTQFENKAQAHAAFKIVIEGIASVLKFGDNLNIKGFGTFKVEERAARKGRNPRTGEEIDIPASKTVKFTPAKALKDALAR